MKGVRGLCLAVVAACAALGRPAEANFHFMQIEQVIGGVDGDTTAQAIQLRMRHPLPQNVVSAARIRVFDATGANPIIVDDLLSNVANGGLGVRVLIASQAFADLLSPSVTPDFIMDNLIPPSYLAAGSLTFENNFGTIVYWRLSWGRGAYTGPTTGSITNDADGQFGPSWPGALPSTTCEALRFQGSASALSTNNAADYALTAGASTWTNNTGSSGTVTLPEDVNGDGVVNVLDLIGLLVCFGMPGTGTCVEEDINGDGTVNVLDLIGLLVAFGTSCP